MRKGLRQGDPLLTCLFNICLDYVVRKIEKNPGDTIFNRICQFLDFCRQSDPACHESDNTRRVFFISAPFLKGNWFICL